METFEDLFSWKPSGSDVYYGTDVLSGLVSGMDAFIDECRSPADSRRPKTPALIGSAMWIDDDQLLLALEKFYGLCITIQKQNRKTSHLASGTDISGMPARALPYLRHRRPAANGEPELIGPYDGPLDDLVVGPFRAFGIRRSPKEKHVPILHAKLALLGYTWWYEDDFSYENQAFTPCKLWISSANFTKASRKSLEFGFWSSDEELMRQAKIFLEIVMGNSESVDPSSGQWAPELLEPDLDNDAFAEAAHETHLAAEEWKELNDEDE